MIILMFYTKQYFVMLALGVFMYLFFCKSWKQAFKFMFFGGISGIVSVLIINLTRCATFDV